MTNKPKISEAEWQVMKVLWRKSPATANEVVEQVSDKKDWNPKTVKTLINRLASKGAISFEKEGRQYKYFPVLSEDDCVQAETSSFLQRAGATAVKPMLAAFIEAQQLSDDDIAELKEILERKGGNQ
ncbi:MAG: BlaI/MecI/CopY family transcriptional regulator [Planctomycetes bacterium]|nr:BlaI/MecI/CopY family transcriptional regulator [Planctomycetota bacterium]